MVSQQMLKSSSKLESVREGGTDVAFCSKRQFPIGKRNVKLSSCAVHDRRVAWSSNRSSEDEDHANTRNTNNVSSCPDGSELKSRRRRVLIRSKSVFKRSLVTASACATRGRQAMHKKDLYDTTEDKSGQNKETTPRQRKVALLENVKEHLSGVIDLKDFLLQRIFAAALFMNVLTSTHLNLNAEAAAEMILNAREINSQPVSMVLESSGTNRKALNNYSNRIEWQDRMKRYENANVVEYDELSVTANIL